MKLEELYELIKNRKEKKPEGSYVVGLLDKGVDSVIQKVGEEAVEVVIAAKNSDKKRIIAESTDLIFHLLILLEMKNIALNDIYGELSKRNKK